MDPQLRIRHPRAFWFGMLIGVVTLLAMSVK
jgi:hypothetical protein